MASKLENENLELVKGGFASIEEAARFLGVCRATIYSLMDRGQIKNSKIGKARRIPWNALHAFSARTLTTP